MDITLGQRIPNFRDIALVRRADLQTSGHLGPFVFEADLKFQRRDSWCCWDLVISLVWLYFRLNLV